MDAVISVAPRRHPWLDRLIAAPGAEVRALAEGTASIHPLMRAEPSDAAATILFNLAADDPAVKAFDQGTLESLTYYRAATARAESKLRDRIGLGALNLMTVVQRLAPRNTVIDLHRRFAYWNAWAETLVLDRGLDLRREYWRLLTLTQDIAADAGLAPRRLLPFWLDICGEAGSRGRYDETYLAVGLLGLRSLPLGEEGANEEAALHGLARWADAQRPPKARFLREWHVLEGAFPRDPTFWTDLVARVLASIEEEIARQTRSARTTFPAADWWREDVEVVRGAHIEPRAGELEPPSRELREALLAHIHAGRPFSTLEPRLRALMQRHERYATRTGDTFYLVRTSCNIGMQLLRGGDVPERRAAAARELARLALQFESANVYAWALWRDALAAEGHLEAAELIGWETIRRFPENPQWRSQLALLLTDHHNRPQEAESLLHETMQMFPDDVVAHAQLANVVGRDTARLKEAIAILQQALVIEPTNRIAQNMKSRFEGGRTSAPPRPATPTGPVAPAAATSPPDLPTDLAASARMRRALFRVRTATPDAREAAKREVELILREDENLAYARYVAAAAEVTASAVDDTVIAAAFLAAAREGSAAALRPFLERAHGVDGVVICMASASRGDGDAGLRMKAWMAEPANDLSPRDQGLRTIAARATAPLPDELIGDMLAASLGTALAA
jgi:tetratricopeptide (TPR) repeat protein